MHQTGIACRHYQLHPKISSEIRTKPAGGKNRILRRKFAQSVGRLEVGKLFLQPFVFEAEVGR